MKKVIAGFLSAILALSVLGCSKAPQEEPAVREDVGKVYFLNSKQENQAAWEALAETYQKKTGISVTVETPEEGSYLAQLQTRLRGDTPPTLFICAGTQAMQDLSLYTLDLSDAAFTRELTTTDFNLYDAGGALKAVGFCYESYGIIVNVDLLNQAGYELEDIYDFASLKEVADDIHARWEELGFYAFTAPGLHSSSGWRFSGQLANLPLYYEFRDRGVTEQPAEITGSYLGNFRQIWDLYITDTPADPAALSLSTISEARALFNQGQAVFYQQGSWEYAVLKEAGLENLAMIPIYCGVEGEEKAGLCSGTDNCWAVNGQASEADIQATLDFLLWVVTSEEGTQMLAQTYGAVPFRNAKISGNPFCSDAGELLDRGNYTITWEFLHAPNMDSWRASVDMALAAYSAEPTDKTWSDVEKAFVEGWAYEYKIANSN